MAVALHIMDLRVAPTDLTTSMMAGKVPANQYVAVSNVGVGSFNYTVTAAHDWITCQPPSGTLGTHASDQITLQYAPAVAGWPAGTSSNTTITIATSDGGGATQTVAVALHIMDLQVTPTVLTNDLMRGLSSSQTLDVANLGVGLLNYTINTGPYDWITVNPASGVLTNATADTISIDYAATLPSGLTTGLLTIATSDGGGATQTVSIIVNVMDLQCNPLAFSNEVLLGSTPPAQELTVANAGAGSFVYRVFSDVDWITPLPSADILSAGQTNLITLNYQATTDWQPGISNATLSVTSTNGGGVTQIIAIVFHVMELNPPANVTASKGTYSDKVQVAWAEVTNATGYQIWRNLANDPGAATNLGSTAELTYADISAILDLTYYYWVKSTNDLGESTFSAADTGYRSLGAPPAPIGVIASAGTYTDKVVVAWQPSPTAIGYEVWRNKSLDSNMAAKISSPDPLGTTYHDTTAVGGVRYYYWIKAKGSNAVVSSFSAPATGWSALSTSGLIASKGLRREIQVKWSPISGAISYELWRNLTADISTATLLTNINATAYSDQAVQPAVIYYYWVKAIGGLSTVLNGPESGWCNGRKWDFIGNGRADPWYYHQDSGRWYVVINSNLLHTLVFGDTDMVAVPEDYDGDGKADFAVYEEASGNWAFMLSGANYQTAIVEGFGGAGYQAVPGDYDRDGKVDLAVYHENSGAWYFMLSGSDYAQTAVSGWGAPGYQAVPADYDGDGKMDAASGNWFLMLSTAGYVPRYINFGAPGFLPVPGEYNGLGHAEIAVYHEASGYWFVRTPSGDYLPPVYFGQTGYVPISADYDGDGRDDVAVFHRSRHDAVWHLMKSREGYLAISGRSSRP